MKILELSIFFLLASTLFAQSEKKSEFSLYGNYSSDSNTIFSIARTKDARFGFVNIEYARTFHENKRMSLKYTASFIPVALLNSPTSHRSSVRIKSRAFGFAPAGLKLRFNSKKTIKPFITLSVGVLFFDKAIPNDSGKKLNFTADVGGGVEIGFKRNRSLMFGYKYYHISNANRGLINPGFDNNIFFVGYRFLSR
jgi:opacity protein-like surface antigen